MKSLARALIYLCAFLELSDDEIVDSDHAVRELENMAAELQQSSPEEKAALKSVLQELIARVRAERVARPKEDRERLIEFYENFMAANGLEEESDS